MQFSGAIAIGNSIFGGGAVPITTEIDSPLSCNGSESSLALCDRNDVNATTNTSSCSLFDDVGIVCQGMHKTLCHNVLDSSFQYKI